MREHPATAQHTSVLGFSTQEGANYVSANTSQQLSALATTYGEAVARAAVAALRAGDSVRGSTSPNPPVGAAIISEDGELVGVGGTSPAGGPHAEINALTMAGTRARRGTAVVTLEPCNHTGRTGPCSVALAQAGISQVIYLTKDPNVEASGGAQYLKNQGVNVDFIDIDVLALGPWIQTIKHNRVSITAKWAHTLDGFTAALDGTSKWITGAQAREFVHEDRSKRDAIIVGTGTVLADDPALTARKDSGELYKNQPVRVIVGTRDIPAHYQLSKSPEAFAGEGDIYRYAGITEAMDALWEMGARDVLVEGGSGLLTSFFTRNLVDFIYDYSAPSLLGQGLPLLTTALTDSMAGIRKFTQLQIRLFGDDVLRVLERKAS